MATGPKPEGAASYQIGDVGDGARVAQGENISWSEGIRNLPAFESLARQFSELLLRIAHDGSLDEDTRLLAQDKTKAIAEGLSQAGTSPALLRRALLDAKPWLRSAASWVGNAVAGILKSDAAQKTLSTITEATTIAAVKSFLD